VRTPSGRRGGSRQRVASPECVLAGQNRGSAGKNCGADVGDQVSATAGAMEISLETLGHAGDFGSLAHYADPAYYDLTYRDRRHDVEFYVGAARGCPDRRVLEFGCGSGRITLPMAQAGAEVTAVDLSRPMLNDLERRLSSIPLAVRRRIHPHHADMRAFRNEEQYSLIIAPFNTVQHLYEPEEFLGFLQRVRERLAEGGKFVFDVSLPQAADLCRDPSECLESPPFTHPETGEVYSYSERFEYDPIRQLLVVWMQFTPQNGGESFTIPLAHRQYYPQELRGLLGCAGFSRVRFFSDFSTEPAGPHTDSLVVECES
jgi:SAM-dependent methyltransferase